MTDLLVYVHAARADTARALVGAACTATGVGVRMEVFGGSGSLYQRLGARRAPPPPDLVWFFGPFAAHAAASDGFLLDAYGVLVSSAWISIVCCRPCCDTSPSSQVIGRWQAN